jgi:DNA-binding PadR family transcriptional regulator
MHTLTHNDLLVLGLLLDRPTHGYEINRHVKAEGVNTWFDVSPAAVYYSLNKLHQQGLISETQSGGGRGEKSVYRATERGREQFFAGMEGALASQQPVRHDYDLGIFFLNKLPQERALGLLEQRVRFLHERQSQLEQQIERKRSTGDALQVAILEHRASCTQVESQWLGSIIEHLQQGALEGDAYRGLMLLSGDLLEFHLPDLVKLIASGKHSGTLSVTDGVHTRTISFHEGRPVCATSRRPDGDVNDPKQVLQDVYDLFRWQEGSFTLDQRMKPGEACTVLEMSARDLILAGSRWVDNWSAIQQVVPSVETVFERRDGQADPAGLVLTQVEERVLEALDGLRDVSDVARMCQLTEFETSKALYSLSTVGLVRPGDLSKIRLRRVFREFAELMCRATIPYRDSPDDTSCEDEVNQCCQHLAVRFVNSRIEDQTDPALGTEGLAKTYRTFLGAQQEVVRQRFGEAVADTLMEQVTSRISPGLRDALRDYDLIHPR